jgi:host factor-I protein
MSDFNTGLPSIRQIQTYIKDRQEVEIKLITDDLIIGKIMWQDNHCLCLLDHYEQSTLIWMQAIVYLKAKA